MDQTRLSAERERRPSLMRWRPSVLLSVLRFLKTLRCQAAAAPGCLLPVHGGVTLTQRAAMKVAVFHSTARLVPHGSGSTGAPSCHQGAPASTSEPRRPLLIRAAHAEESLTQGASWFLLLLTRTIYLRVCWSCLTFWLQAAALVCVGERDPVRARARQPSNLNQLKSQFPNEEFEL